MAYVVTHPIQYQAPLLRRLAREPGIELKVFFLSDLSLREHHERDFGQSINWDLGLVDGYDWEVLPRLGSVDTRKLRPCWPLRAIGGKIREGRFDALWIHGWGHIGLIQAILVARSQKIPILIRGESLPERTRQSLLSVTSKVRRLILRLILRQASGYLAIGSLNQIFYEQFKVPPKRIHSVPYAVDNQRFQSECAIASKNRETLRAELNLEKGRPILLFAAKFISVKNPILLIQAFKKAFPSWFGPKPYLLFVGAGPLVGEMEKEAAIHLGQDIRFLGFRNQTEIAAFYDLCDLFILPSRFEPWGLVLNEVMNAARPVVASNSVGAARDLIEEGVNGWTFRSGDVDDLVRVLLQIPLSDLITMGARSFQRINSWSFEEDVQGIRRAMEIICSDGEF